MDEESSVTTIRSSYWNYKGSEIGYRFGKGLQNFFVWFYYPPPMEKELKFYKDSAKLDKEIAKFKKKYPRTE